MKHNSDLPDNSPLSKHSPRVLVAGIGGASLGTEVLKCLTLAKRYAIFGCDISRLAFGHYHGGCEQTFHIDRENYVDSILEACRKARIDFIIPGGEEPLVLLSEARDKLFAAGVHLAANSEAVVRQFSDKLTTFRILAELGFPVPRTRIGSDPSMVEDMTFPCVVKPASGGGGSSFVFLAENCDEALLYVSYLAKNGKQALVQEYISAEDGEFTIGVLSLPDGKIAGSVAMKRILESKLSVLLKSKSGMISTGYSQGLIDDFPNLRTTAEKIAEAIRSTGPINIQGRVRDGQFIPFEINPRFSASTYLRALAGFNEIDVYLQYMTHRTLMESPSVRPGYYLRSLDEIFVQKDGIVG